MRCSHPPVPRQTTHGSVNSRAVSPSDCCTPGVRLWRGLDDRTERRACRTEQLADRPDRRRSATDPPSRNPVPDARSRRSKRRVRRDPQGFRFRDQHRGLAHRCLERIGIDRDETCVPERPCHRPRMPLPADRRGRGAHGSRYSGRDIGLVWHQMTRSLVERAIATRIRLARNLARTQIGWPVTPARVRSRSPS